MGTIKTTNIETITGSGTLTLGQSGETISIPSGVTITNNGTQTGFGGTNTPMFYGRLTSSLALSRNVNTKVTGMTTNEIDTDSAFDGTTFTVPSGKGGRYFFTAYGYFDFNTEGNDGESVELRFKINNTTSYAVAQYQMSVQGQIARFPLFISSIIDLNAGDYIEIFAQCYDQTGSGTGGTLFSQTFFSGYKIIE